jgi:hypothetical protein
MNRRAYAGILTSICLALSIGFLTSCTSTVKTPPAPTVVITATSGTPQSAMVGAAFVPLVATVTTNGTATPGASVTFTAPGSDPTGTFVNSTNTETDTTDANGVATSSVFTASMVAGAYTVTASVAGTQTPANFNLTNTAGPPSQVIVSSGSPQYAIGGAAFAAPLVATVEDSDGNPLTGVSVTFTAPASGASGMFATSTNTETDVTDASGNATSSVFTSNTTPGAVTVAATATGTTPANFILNITTALALADGNYVFSLAGSDTFTGGFPYFVSGVVNIAGGFIIAGEQDFIDLNTAQNDMINPIGSSVATSADGNFILTLNTCNQADCTTTDTAVGVGGLETMNGTFLPLNANRAFITEFDLSASASGELDLQNATAAAATPANGYAFGLNGLDTNGAAQLAIGGVINVDGPGTISGTGSIFDANDGGSVFTGESLATSTVSVPDALGRVTFTLNPATDFLQIILVGYIVDSGHIRLVETNDDNVGTLGGTAFGQGANTGAFAATLPPGTSYVVSMNGIDTAGFLQTVGLVTANSDGSVSGFVDFNDLSGSEPVIPDPVTAPPSYTVDPTGRVTITGLADNATPPVADFNLQLYLDGNGNAIAITLDANDTIGGVGYLQSGGGGFGTGSFNGAYAMGVTGWDGGTTVDDNFIQNEFDAAGPASAGGGNISGAVDLNWLFTGTFPDSTFTGTYTAASNGVFTDGLTGLDLLNGPGNPGLFDYYLIDATGDSFLIETDTNQLTQGYFFQQ